MCDHYDTNTYSCVNCKKRFCRDCCKNYRSRYKKMDKEKNKKQLYICTSCIVDVREEREFSHQQFSPCQLWVLSPCDKVLGFPEVTYEKEEEYNKWLKLQKLQDKEHKKLLKIEEDKKQNQRELTSTIANFERRSSPYSDDEPTTLNDLSCYKLVVNMLGSNWGFVHTNYDGSKTEYCCLENIRGDVKCVPKELVDKNGGELFYETKP